MGNLKMAADYYGNARRTVFDFLSDVRTRGWSATWKDARDWGQMRMARTDLSDVTGYTFLVNGKSPDQNWTGLFVPGERVRLRFINASTMSFFDVRIPKAKVVDALKSPLFALPLVQKLAHDLQATRMRAETLALRTVKERLDAWLLFNGPGLSPPKARTHVMGHACGAPKHIFL